MKKLMIAAMVAASAWSGSVALAHSERPVHRERSAHGSQTIDPPGGPTGWAYRLPGNNAELQGDNGNSGGGANSLNNNNNLGNGP
jgi:hypothetical protein